jgi:hypothetical protein
LHSRKPAHPFVDSKAMSKATSLIAVSDSSNDDVDVYTSAGKLVAELTGFSEPQGMSSDIKGDLYVADTGNSRIQMLAAGFQGEPTSLLDPGQYPVGVDSFGNGKVVATANIESTSGGGGSVTFFAGGKPVKTITSPNLAEAFFCAFDAKGNLFVSGFDGNFDASIGEIVGGINGSTYTELTTSNVIAFPGGIQVTTNGKIAVDDQEGGVIDTYDPPVGNALGAPVVVTPLAGSSDPVTFAFTRNMSALWAADAGLGGVQEFLYPSGAKGSTIDTGGEPIGVAVLPSEFPKR